MTGIESVWAIVLAGGRGSRFGGEVPKQYLDLWGHPLLHHSLRALLEVTEVAGVVVPTATRDIPRLEAEVLPGLGILKPVLVVPGGAERADSVRNGLDAVPTTARWVLVHDGARPCPGPAMLARLLAARVRARAVIPVLPVTDTLKEVDAEGQVVRTVDRRVLRRAQTPQLFAREILVEAHRGRRGDATDDAQLVEGLGETVLTVEGDPGNVKVTRIEDLEALRRIPGRIRT